MSTPAKRIRRKTARKSKLLRFLLVVVLFAVVATGGTAAALVISAAKTMPSWNPKALQPSIPSTLLDKNGDIITKLYAQNCDPIAFAKIPTQFRNAVLSIEDIRFYQHSGLDYWRIAGALWADIKAGKAAEGGSTITQQLVKRAFLTPDKTLERKIQEALLAIDVERKYTKDEIFGMYVNQIYYGEGAYGIQSAAQAYFNKDISQLNLEETALLAGLPQAPSHYDPFNNVDAATYRRNLVLDNMAKYGYITTEQADTAKATPVVLTGSGVKKSRTDKYPYFVSYVTRLLVNKYGDDMVYKGGLKVTTSLDPKIQTYAEEALANPKNFPKSTWDKNGIIQPEAAMVVLDPHTGNIKALVGGRKYQKGSSFNRAVDAVRQPGSCFKPLMDYGPAIEADKSQFDVIEDAPLTIGDYTVKNYDGGYHGWVTYRQAITNSYNIPAVKILNEIGIQTGIDFVKKLGISTLVEASDNYQSNDENLSSALGGLTKGVKPLELAAAYGAFDNNGVYIKPTAIIKVEDSTGNILDQFTPQKTIAMKESTAAIMTNMMQSVVNSGTGTAARLGARPVAGKTGTTSDYKDAWFAGYTPELVGVVWIGNDRPKTMHGVTGGTYPAKIWRAVMSKALADAPVKNFEVPKGVDVWSNHKNSTGSDVYKNPGQSSGSATVSGDAYNSGSSNGQGDTTPPGDSDPSGINNPGNPPGNDSGQDNSTPPSDSGNQDKSGGSPPVIITPN